MDPTSWNLPFPMVVAALFVIVMVRANGTYWIGRAAAGGARKTRASTFIDRPAYRRAERLIDRWGAPAVTLCFLTIGVQTMVNFVAGASRMALRRYLPAVVLGSLIWALVYATVGVAGWTALTLLYAKSPGLAIGLVVVLVAFLASFIAVHVIRTREEREQQTRPDTEPITSERD